MSTLAVYGLTGEMVLFLVSFCILAIVIIWQVVKRRWSMDDVVKLLVHIIGAILAHIVVGTISR